MGVEFGDKPISVNNWSSDDFSTTSPTYFFTENSFQNVLGASLHAIDRFGWVKVITWPSVEMKSNEKSNKINENQWNPMVFVDFSLFSLIFHWFSLILVSTLGHVMPLTTPNRLIEWPNTSRTFKNGFSVRKYVGAILCLYQKTKHTTLSKNTCL